jgi:hypothetical protein
MRLIKWIYKPSGNCPVQAEGYFLGKYFYFRSRWDQATIEFYENPVAFERGDAEIAAYVLAEVDSPKAGWMPKWKCRLLIWAGCAIFAYKSVF